jgi:uncharacterized membrane protein (UPF0127 family)
MAKPKKTEQKNDNSYYKYVYIAVFILIAGYIIFSFFSDKKENKYTLNTKTLCDTIPEPQFKKEGELVFLDKEGKKEVKKIDIEVADKDRKRMFGLMCRKAMDDGKGMLFVFEQSDEHSFWMKNTLMSLDILFINERKEIIKIHKKTTPLSEKSLPSNGSAIFVVEVASGFTDRYKINEGDKINFQKQ